MTRASFAQKLEALRLEWNDTGHEAIGWRKPNDVMLEFISAQRTRFSDPKDVRRNLALAWREPGTQVASSVAVDGARLATPVARVASLVPR